MAVALTGLACGPSPRTPPRAIPGSQIVTGIVIAAVGPDATQVDRFTLRDDGGVVLDFEVGHLDLSEGGLAAPHLREHLVSGEPIQVTYRPEADRLVALRYEDAPP